MKTVKVELTTAEYCVVSEIINMVYGFLEYDDDLKAYSDGGRFIYSCNKHQLNALKRAVDKL